MLEYQVVDNKTTPLFDMLNKDFTSILRPQYILAGKEKVCMSETFKNIAEEIENFEVFEDDIFLISYPKTGTTWTGEMVWRLLYEVNSDFTIDNEEMKLPTIPFLELKGFYNYNKVLEEEPNFELPFYIFNSINLARDYPLRPRVIKTHLPWSLLPKQIREHQVKPKIIYVARNVKDTCVSYYHHSLLVSGHTGSLDDFCSLFHAGFVMYGSYISHVRSYWRQKNHPNIIFIHYESMQKNLPYIIETISAFINKPLLKTDPRMQTLVQNLSFENMKINMKSSTALNIVNVHKRFYRKPIQGNFMRKGIVGSHKQEMTEKNIKMLNKWIELELNEGELKNILMGDNDPHKHYNDKVFH